MTEVSSEKELKFERFLKLDRKMAFFSFFQPQSCPILSDKNMHELKLKNKHE